jgi:hypothetical protein
MTAAVVDLYAPQRPADALERLVTCSHRYLGTPGWWARLADGLDELRAHLAHADTQGLVAQVIADAPELAASALRLPDLDDEAQAHAALLRLEVAEKAGRRSEALQMREAVKTLLGRVRRVERISDDLLHDAYQRDFGGE